MIKELSAVINGALSVGWMLFQGMAGVYIVEQWGLWHMWNRVYKYRSEQFEYVGDIN